MRAWINPTDQGIKFLFYPQSSCSFCPSPERLQWYFAVALGHHGLLGCWLIHQHKSVLMANAISACWGVGAVEVWQEAHSIHKCQHDVHSQQGLHERAYSLPHSLACMRTHVRTHVRTQRDLGWGLLNPKTYKLILNFYLSAMHQQKNSVHQLTMFRHLHIHFHLVWADDGHVIPNIQQSLFQRRSEEVEISSATCLSTICCFPPGWRLELVTNCKMYFQLYNLQLLESECSWAPSGLVASPAVELGLS